MKIVAFDIETTSLEASLGRILCASFQPVWNNGERAEPYTFRGDSKKFKRKDPLNDMALCEAIRDELEKYHCIVTWNGKLFDVPFLQARLLKHEKRRFHPHLHADMMWYAGGNSNRIGSKRLATVQEYLSLESSKTPLDRETWQRAAAFHKESFDKVVEHCEADVKVLEEAYWRLLPAVANLHK